MSLTGPGGTGKTRLAAAVAAAVARRVCFVDLAPLSDPRFVPPAIAQALDVREVEGLPLAERLLDALAGRETLLLLDNFEHVLGAAPFVADLLGACPGLTVLATSRAPLRLRWEHEFPVWPLDTPDPATLGGAPDPAQLERYPAVALFLARARAARPDFALTAENARAVAEICHRLDGLPLAIELAAPRVKLLHPQEILRRLSEGPDGSSLRLLAGGPRDLPARQQTLRGTIAWSYDLLDGAEQALCRRLAVFTGSFPLDGAAAVATPGDPIPLLAGPARRRPARTSWRRSPLWPI